MKAVRFHEFGEPEDIVRVEEVDAPTLRDGEVLVRFMARPISPSVLLTLRGKYGVHPTLPAIPGAEAAGRVVSVTKDCRSCRVGDRVTLIPASLGIGTDGTWRELAAIDEDKLLPTPEALTDAEASTAWANYLTMWLMATRVVPLRPRDVVIATALGSHCGRALLEMARVRDFVVIGTVRAGALVPELTKLGAAAVATSADELRRLADEQTGGRGVRAVFDAVGGPTGTGALGCLADGGDFVAYGMLSDQPLHVDNAALTFRGLRLGGFWLTKWLRSAPAGERDAVIRELAGYFERATFTPAVDREFAFDDVREAVRYAKRSGRHGKVVLAGP